MAIPVRVLLVEDTPDDADLVLMQLRREGYYPAWQRVETEQAFLDRLNPPPELILADWSLPQFSGLRALELLAMHKIDLPLLIVSGNIGEEAAIAATRMGAYDFVPKNNLSRLGTAVRRALEQKRLKDERIRTEQALRISEDRFQHILQTANEGIWVVDENNLTTLVNQKMADMLGYSIQEIIGRSLMDFIYEEEIGDFQEKIKQRMRGESGVYERRYRRKDGQTVWVHLSTTALHDSTGAYRGSFAMVTDISERKAGERALHQSQQHLNRIFEAASVGIVTVNPEGRIMQANPAFCEMVAYSQEQLVNMRVADLTVAEDLAATGEIIASLVSGKTDSRVIDKRYLRADGTDLWGHTTASSVRDLEGKVLYLVAVIDNITERKQADDRLRESEENFRQLAESIHGVFWLRDEQTRRIVYVSPGFETIWGRPLADLYAEPELFDRALDPRDVEMVVSADRQMREQGIPLNVRHRILRPDGELRWVWVRVFPVRNSAGQTVRQAGIAEDITDLVRTEEALLARTTELETLFNLSKGLRSAATEHEILEIISREMRLALHIDAAMTIQVAPDGQTYQVTYADGLLTNNLHKVIALPGTLVEKALQSGQAYEMFDYGHHTQRNQAVSGGDALGPVVAVQMHSDLGLIGVMGFGRLHGKASFSPAEAHLLAAVADLAGNAIRRVRLFEDLRQANDQAIEGWSRAMDMRDHETEDHSQQVTDLTLHLAEKMGIDSSLHVHIWRGARLHDIGKLAVPDQILWKPGPLDEAEWVLMRKHPEWARDMLLPIPFLQPALEIPYCHHEKWDGSGYPRGLKGEEIPIAARIFAVADVFQALTSRRAYREAWDARRAVEYIRSQAGKHFDPQVVQAFIEVMQEG